MAKNLLIVESPAKAKTINKYLGKDFTVLASYGHVRDLVPKEGAVDPDNGFAMRYDLIEKNEKHVAAIAKAAKSAEGIFLATDPDREGEAISWHIAEILKERGLLKDKTLQRVVFTEITPRAIKEAMAHPRDIAGDLVDAQQARRALDYLVGFNLSPVLWRKVQRGLSAGRVQSPALRMIVEREEEIEAFIAREYWSIEAECAHPSQAFTAKLTRLDGKKFEQFTVTDGDTAEEARRRIVAAANGALHVTDVASKERKRRPAAPFTTSTLQQEASRKLGFTTRRTMQVAQKLYEGVAIGEEGTVGLISYMRTDSVNLSAEALSEIRDVIARDFGTARVARQAQRLPDQVEERAGSARSRAPDLGAAHAGAGRALPQRRRAPPVRTGLEARRRLADGAGHAQHRQRRPRRRQRAQLPRQRHHRGRSGLPRRLRGRQGHQGRGRRGRRPQAAGDEDRRPRAARPHPHRPALHPAAAALHRSVAGQDAGGIRHRPSFHLRLDHPDAAVPQVRRDGRPRFRPSDVGRAVSQLPQRPFHPLRRLRLHRQARGRTRCGVARRGGMGAADGEVLGAVQGTGRREDRIGRPQRSHRRARARHRSEIRQAGQRAPRPLRAVRRDRQHRRDRGGEADLRVAAPRPEHAHDHAATRRSTCSGCRASSGRTRTRKSASASAASVRSPSAAACTRR